MWWKSVPSTTPSSGFINWKNLLGFCAGQAVNRKTEYLPFQPVDFSPQTTVDVRSQSSLVSLDFGEWGPFREQVIPCGQWWSVSQFSCLVVSDSLHGLQHARLPCPSPTPGACSNSCLSSQWCHPTISSSVIPFSSCPASGVLLRSRSLHVGGGDRAKECGWRWPGVAAPPEPIEEALLLEKGGRTLGRQK